MFLSFIPKSQPFTLSATSVDLSIGATLAACMSYFTTTAVLLSFGHCLWLQVGTHRYQVALLPLVSGSPALVYGTMDEVSLWMDLGRALGGHTRVHPSKALAWMSRMLLGCLLLLSRVLGDYRLLDAMLGLGLSPYKSGNRPHALLIAVGEHLLHVLW